MDRFYLLYVGGFGGEGAILCADTRCMKSTEFCFIEEIVQWWLMANYILKHR